jgi:hypothetical protein
MVRVIWPDLGVRWQAPCRRAERDERAIAAGKDEQRPM